MKILKISGDSDYAALQFEDEFEDPMFVMSEMIDKKKTEKTINLKDKTKVFAEILEFNTPEELFEYFKSNIQDYDDSKHTNYYGK
jgi:hypothetical protein